jgi:hypothetical protein
MRCIVSVTFEFDLRPSVTHRVEVEGRSAETIWFRAGREARKQLKPKGWTSAVACILERLDDKEDGETEEDSDMEALTQP